MKNIMNKQELLQLEKMATLSPKEIEKQQPALFSKLSERASISLKNTIEAKLKDAAPEIKTSLKKIDFTLSKLGKADVKIALSKNLLAGRISAEKKKKLEEVVAKLPNLGKLDDIIQPELPVFINPTFQPDLMKAKLYRLSDIAGLSQIKTDKALVKELNLNSISSEKLNQLVKDKILSEKEAKELGVASNLYTLFDSSFELTEHVKKTLPAVQSIEDLIRLGRSDWEKLVKDSKIELPGDLKQKEYAEVLYKKVENIFPEETLIQRISQVKANDISKGLGVLKTIIDKNEKVFGITSFDELKTDGISAKEVKKQKVQFEAIDKVAKMHPGLKLNEILNDNNLSNADIGKRVTERIGLLDKFVENNPEVNFLAISYTHDSEDIKSLNFQGFKPEEKAMVLNSAKSYQRVYSFTNDIEHTEVIMAAGFHSSFHITSVTLPEFIKATNLDTLIATKYFENAHMGMIRTSGVMGSILDILTGSFDWTAVGNSSPSIKDYLKDIPGYQDLFGDLAFCECEHCHSIYSPAAYFVDLMQFVERYVISKHFTGAKASHVLNLKVRRPDLWTLPLTCENTSTLVPYLDIINEILESYIAKKKGFVGDLNNRSAVEDFVYKGEIALEKPGTWKDHVHSFTQPFNLPLESVSTYLSHFEKSREDIALVLGKPQDVISKARLNLSEKEHHLITNPNNSPAFIKRVYGEITFTITAGKITPFNAQLLLKPMGLNRKELGRLLKSRFVTNNGNDNINIHSEKIDADSIQNDIERVINLTYNALDRAHRFVRLWRKTNWSIQELDLMLTQLNSSGVAAGIIPATITAIGNLIKLQEKLKLSVEELCACWYRIPALIIKENQKSMLDTLFNHEDVVLTEGNYPKEGTKLIHPALVINKLTASAEFSSSRLMAGLNRSDDEVLALIQNLAQPLGIIAIDSATESERGFNITIANLSLLYKHSKIAEILKVSIGDLFRLIRLTPTIPNGYLESSNQIDELLNFHTWWKSTSFSIDELNYIIESGDVASPDNFKTKEEITSYIIEQCKTTNALLFAETVFASFDDVTEEQSKSIILANNAVIEAAVDGTNFWLKPSFDPNAAIALPAGITRSEPEIRTLLTKYNPQYLVPFYLSSQMRLTEEAINKITSAIALDLDADAFALELQGTTTPAVAIPNLVEKILPLGILFKNKKFNSEALTYVLNHLPVFVIANLDNITIDNIQKLYSFTKFIIINEDGSHNVQPLTEILSSFDNGTQYQTSDQEKLANLLLTKPEQLATTHAVISPSSNAVQALEQYKKVIDISSYIGIGGDVLQKIVATSYDELNEATNSILAVFRSKYKTETERKEKLEKYQDKLRGKKRASLTTYLIHSGFPQFENENDLFHYFLIDTELEGCARTSRLVAATMSLQLYVQRILLNLEQDNQEPGTAGRVNINIDPSDPTNLKYKPIPEDEWSWRKNYRVWEANRKVFLYPENYIEPELRDDKSPLFKELENELLQQEINADTVLDAYAKYMRGFDEVAHLKIAGSYHEKDEKSETDVLHLFGVTADEPPMYYYRTVENSYYSEKNDNRGVVWNPWEKITVQIPVRKVAPITYNGRLHVFWVKVTTLANTVFDSNRSVFTGYSHKYSIEFTTLKLDGTWTPPQKLNLKDCYPFTGNGVVQDPLAEDVERSALQGQLANILTAFPFFTWNNDWNSIRTAINDLKTPRYALNPHYEPIDEYTLDGFLWDQVYPNVDPSGRLVLTGAGYQMRAAIDFYNLKLIRSGGSRASFLDDPVREAWNIIHEEYYRFTSENKVIEKSGSNLHRAISSRYRVFDDYAYGELITNTTKSNALLGRIWDNTTLNFSFDNIRQEQIANLYEGSIVHIVNGAYGDAIIDAQGDLLLLQGTPIDGNGFVLKRLGTTLSETLTRTLFTSGVETTLSIETQKKLKEYPASITIENNGIEDLVVRDKIDFKGAYGNYYREIFFHIPFLLANHLNSQGKYAEAQKWYHYIFNPSATEVMDLSAPGLTAAQKKKMDLDRNWQYLEFREIDTQKLRDQLNDKQAIEVYKKDPFNPHAIARLRISAYQKSIVMKYIDNLLDWADQLFSQDTMESINEATLLYIIAKEILGDRPAEIGECGEGKVNPNIRKYSTTP
jgi:Neuraminidase-like domain/Salmonella virulence plasmid 28.1kDa A protein